METDKIIKFGRICLSLLAVGAFFFVLLKYAVPLILPFAVAYGAAYGVRRLSEKLSFGSEKFRKARSAVIITLIICLAAALLWIGVTAFIRELGEALPKLAEKLGGPVAEKVSRIVYELGERFGGGKEFSEKVYSAIGSVAASLAGGSREGGARALPGILFGTALAAIAFFSFVFGDFRISNYIVATFPENKRDDVKAYIHGALTGVGKYLRVCAVVIGANAAVLAAALYIVKSEHVVLLSVIIAFLDILPVFGVGTVLIPWALYCFVTSAYLRGAVLLSAVAVVGILRQSLEAKLLGRGVGLPPVFMIFAVYAGYKLSGVSGMILLPMSLNIAYTARNEADKKRNCS